MHAAQQSTESPAPESTVAAAKRWVRDFGDALWRFALARTRSVQVAEEVVQDTILAAMQSHERFAGAASEQTWLLGIAAHKIADHFRRLRRRSAVETRCEPPDLDAAVATFEKCFTRRGAWSHPPRTWSGPWGRARSDEREDVAEMREALKECMNALPPALAEAVWLRDCAGIASEEVCRILDVTPNNLWTRTHRARSSLRLCIERAMGLE